MPIELAGALSDINESTVKAYADASKLTEGEHEIDVHIEGPQSVTQMNRDKIKIKLVKQEGQ